MHKIWMGKYSEQKGRQCALVLFLRLPANADPEVVMVIDGPNGPDIHHVSITVMRDDWPVQRAERIDHFNRRISLCC